MNELRSARFAEFDTRVVPAGELSVADLAIVRALFEANYRQANWAYVEKSLGRLRNAAIALHGEVPAGFSLGESRDMDLPRLPGTRVTFAGICCIAPEFRRRGLFGYLEALAIGYGVGPPPGRHLRAGRMAHPASYRLMSRDPSAVPKRGVRPTRWQQEVGVAIAEAYGSPGFDPETFVVTGSGVPIGYPAMEIDATEEEWELFKPVNRDKGDSLLGIAWSPDAPDGWDTPDP
jgi:hypothetical protein